MRKDRLLESYIRSYLIKESISSDDHDDIEDAVSRLKSALSSRGMSLESLDFTSEMICNVRDRKPVKDLGQIKRDKPESWELRDDREESKSYADILANKKELNVGLGFNPFNALSSKNSYYVERIEEFINILDTFNRNLMVTNRSNRMSKFLKNVLLFKEAVEEAGLKVLGAGIFRIALIDPSNKSVVLKIGLSEKGRKDCKTEIEHSMGRGKGRRQHTKNFPTIYHYDKEDFSWYAIEKVLFIDDDTFNNPPPDFFTDIKSQFRTTFKFFKKLKASLPANSAQNIQLIDIFEKYISSMFKFGKGEIDQAHKEYDEEISKQRNSKLANFLKDFIEKIKTIIFGVNLSNKKSKFKVPEQEVYNNLFKNHMLKFVENFAHAATENMSKQNKMQVFVNILDKLDKMSQSEFNKISGELYNLFDHAIVANLKDIHLGNVGFKKVLDDETYEERWKLIFTDIDSN